jgi:hypothetical protein
MTAEERFHEIARELPEGKEGKMFGALCIKAPNGKAAVIFSRDHMVFKLPEPELGEVLSLDGASEFDPMGGRPMRGWVQLPFEYADRWPSLAKQAVDYVKTLEK